METVTTRLAKFGVLVSLEPPSIICYVCLMHHILFNQASRRAIHNHGHLLLLFVGFITVVVDLNMILDFLRTGVVAPSNDSYCRTWAFIDNVLYALVCQLTLWVSIERHILIFHHRQWLNTKRKRFIFHYTPPVIISAYLTAFYAYSAFIYPCENHFDYHQVCCGSLCYFFENPSMGFFDQLANTIIPSFLIVIVNTALWCRIVWQKIYRMGQGMEWRKHRRIIVQFVPVAMLYMVGYIIYGCIQCYQLTNGSAELIMNIQRIYLFYLFYLVALLHPFFCLMGMPEVYQKWVHTRNRLIFPTGVPAQNRANALTTNHT